MVKLEAEKKLRSNVRKRSKDVKQVRKEKLQKLVQHLGKQASIQANAKDLRILTKAQSERRIADRKKHQTRVNRKSDEEKKKRKTIADQQKAILAKRATLVSGTKLQKKESSNQSLFQKTKNS